MTVHGRSSDAGPAPRSHCPRCEAPTSQVDIGLCVVCERLCCSDCAQQCDDGFYCEPCLLELIQRMVAELPDVELGAPL